MGEHGTVILAVSGGFLVLSVIAALVWWSLADRVFPGADRATGQRVDVMRARGRRPGSKRSGSGAEATPTVVMSGGSGSKERVEGVDGPDGGGGAGDGGGGDGGGGGGGGGD